MKTIGIMGGMSWESTLLYYRLINEGVRARLGGLHSGSILLDSCDFAPMEKLQSKGDWDAIGEILSEKAKRLQAAGAEGVLIATNSMHEVAARVEAILEIPLLHIADAAGMALKRDGVSTIGLLGTRFTMERAFYTDRLKNRFGIDTLVPGSADRELVHGVIYKELCRGVIDSSSRSDYLRIMDDLAGQGAEAVVLGCTEIGILLGEEDTEVPLYDTCLIHTDAAVLWMLGEER
jgi:aspartate racemase